MLHINENDEIIQRIKEGNVAAFKEFFNYYQPRIVHYIYCYVHNKSVAEDIAQDTFFEFWKARGRIDTALSPKSFLYKIARNKSLNYLTRLHHTVAIDDEEEYLSLNSGNNITEKIDTDALIKKIEKAINNLPPRCRSVFILSRYNELSYNEIADALNISLQTVKNQINKALSILRKELEAN